MNARALLIALFLVGALLRIVVFNARPLGTVLVAPDENEIFAISQSIASGNGFALNGVTTAYRDFLAPHVNGSLLAVFGGGLNTIFIFQLVLSLGTGFLLYLLSIRRFSAKNSIVVCGTWLLYPAAVMMPSLVLTETLFVFLWTLSMVLHDRMEDSEYFWPDVLWLAMVLGLTVLARMTGLLWVAAVIIYLLLIRYETPYRIRIRAAVLLTTVCIVMILPWMIRNSMVMDCFSLNTNGGLNLLIGNNPHARGAYFFDEEVQNLLPDESQGETVRDRAGTNYAVNYFFSHLQSSLELWPRKFAYFWSTDMTLLIHYVPIPGETSLANHLRQQPLWWLIVLSLPYAIIVLFGMAGFYLVKKFPSRGLFILHIFFSVLACMIAFGGPRYHLPVMPAMIIGAAAYFEHKPWHEAPQWRKLFMLLAIGLFGGIWLFEAATIAGF